MVGLRTAVGDARGTKDIRRREAHYLWSRRGGVSPPLIVPCLPLTVEKLDVLRSLRARMMASGVTRSRSAVLPLLVGLGDLLRAKLKTPFIEV